MSPERKVGRRESTAFVPFHGAESERLARDERREVNWKRWGPYLAERQWGTVREDYSADGNCWDYFPHDHARSRAYRWGEDGLLGICDREGRLCFSVALWNRRDPILKERLFGLTNPEGNHGEDVKEVYFYLDSTPTHSYMKALYKYPQREFPYRELVEENRRRGKGDPEFEIEDTGVFDDDRYFDVFAEYAKADADDILIRLTIANRAPEPAGVDVVPTIWFRNTWSWGRTGEGYWKKPRLSADGEAACIADHESLGRFRLEADSRPTAPAWLFTENETNAFRLYGAANATPFVKDAFHERIVAGRADAVNPQRAGTKAGAWYRLDIPAGGEVRLSLRLSSSEGGPGAGGLGADFDAVFEARIQEAEAFWESRLPAALTAQERPVARQAYAGLLWTKQFYHFSVRDWLEGDPVAPPVPESRRHGRNSTWTHLYNRDVVSMPDKWEYPWYAAWDLGFQMLPFARIDPHFAKEQLILLLREWYTSPSGQIPAYEFAFSDVNPPVHAWAAWRTYKIAAPHGQRDRLFLKRVFQKLLINFTWWVNRKDPEGKNLFAGGFLGLDNIGVFDRSAELPNGGHLEQADGTAWMAFFCSTMLAIALELASQDPVYEDVASKFFEHFVAITDAMNGLGGTGLWDEQDGFYYDQIHAEGRSIPLRLRSIVGLVPLFAVEILDQDQIDELPGFRKRLQWFLDNRQDLARHISYMQDEDGGRHGGHRLLAIPSRPRLERVLRYLFDESEFLSPHGIRALSRAYAEHPYSFDIGGQRLEVRYDPGVSTTGVFGGNSNWRGPVWFPMNYLLIEALERYHHFYGDDFQVEFPTRSGNWITLAEASRQLARRLAYAFVPDATGRRPCFGDDPRFATDPHWKDHLLFHEYFHGDTGRGLGASHQTGWTALVARCLETVAATRVAAGAGKTASPGKGREEG